jgi:hypothetical protein
MLPEKNLSPNSSAMDPGKIEKGTIAQMQNM